jgi:hypothetical protein
MTGRCCAGKGLSGPIARRLAGAATSVLPGAVLVLLPKCPLCLAAWLTLFTGIGVSEATAAQLRGLIVVFSIAAIALIAARMIRAYRLQRYTQSSAPRPLQ